MHLEREIKYLMKKRISIVFPGHENFGSGFENLARHSHHRRRCCCPRQHRDNAFCRAIGHPGGRIVRRSTADASKRRTRNRPDDKPFPGPSSPSLRRPRCVRISRTLRRKLCKHVEERPSRVKKKCINADIINVSIT